MKYVFPTKNQYPGTITKPKSAENLVSCFQELGARLCQIICDLGQAVYFVLASRDQSDNEDMKTEMDERESHRRVDESNEETDQQGKKRSWKHELRKRKLAEATTLHSARYTSSTVRSKVSCGSQNISGRAFPASLGGSELSRCGFRFTDQRSVLMFSFCCRSIGVSEQDTCTSVEERQKRQCRLGTNAR